MVGTEHFFVEVAGTLRRAEIHDEIPPARIAKAFSELVTSAIHRVQVRALLSEAWAMRANITVADAVYVALAEHLGAKLVTADLKLADARTLTVETIHP